VSFVVGDELVTDSISNVGEAPFSLEDHSRRLGGDLRNGLRRLKRREEGGGEFEIKQAKWKSDEAWVLSGRSTRSRGLSG
jgi:hypothetical protein